MKLATWNVNSLTVRLPQVLDWLAAQTEHGGIDVLALQETKTTDDKFPKAEIVTVQNVPVESCITRLLTFREPEGAVILEVIKVPLTVTDVTQTMLFVSFKIKAEKLPPPVP